MHERPAKILIVAANPFATERLRLDAELREIEAGLRRASRRDAFELVVRPAIRVEDLRRGLLDEQPAVLHFAGHAQTDGILLEGADGQAHTVSGAALAGLFKLFNEHLRCVVLNACYSADQGEAIRAEVDYLVGMSGTIGDTAARTFAVAFYDALGAGREPRFAFEYACNALRLSGEDHAAPVFFQRESGTQVNHPLDRQGNSFNPTVPALPPNFVGRAAELRQLGQWLDEGVSALIEGDFRIGKTSLLHTWAQQVAGRAVHVLDGQGEAGCTPAALVYLVTGARVEDNPDQAADQLKKWAAAQALPPLLLFDEAPAFVRNFPLRFFERLRGMLQQRELVAVFASPRDLDALYQEQNDTSPLTNCLRHLRLGLLDADAAGELAARGRDSELLLHWAGRHPFYLQLLGAHLASGREDALEQFCDEAGEQLKKVWRVLTPREQGVLCGAPGNTRSLRLRGLLNADGAPFGEVLRGFLEEICA